MKGEGEGGHGGCGGRESRREGHGGQGRRGFNSGSRTGADGRLARWKRIEPIRMEEGQGRNVPGEPAGALPFCTPKSIPRQIWGGSDVSGASPSPACLFQRILSAHRGRRGRHGCVGCRVRRAGLVSVVCRAHRRSTQQQTRRRARTDQRPSNTPTPPETGARGLC